MTLLTNPFQWLQRLQIQISRLARQFCHLNALYRPSACKLQSVERHVATTSASTLPLTYNSKNKLQPGFAQSATTQRHSRVWPSTSTFLTSSTTHRNPWNRSQSSRTESGPKNQKLHPQHQPRTATATATAREKENSLILTTTWLRSAILTAADLRLHSGSHL